jgi:hypothetical protein
VAKYELRVAKYELRVAKYELRVAKYELRVRPGVRRSALSSIGGVWGRAPVVGGPGVNPAGKFLTFEMLVGEF